MSIFSALFILLVLQDLPKEPLEEGAAKAGDELQASGGVLDFSSGSEDEEDRGASKRKMVTPGAMDSSIVGNVASGPGRVSLLQHGFSKLLETVKIKADGGDGESSSDVGENPSGEESEDEQEDATPTTPCTKSNDDSGPSKVCTKTWELSSCSDTEATGFKVAESRVKAFPSGQSRKMQQKRRNAGSSRRCLENYSDESDDLDVTTTSKNGGRESHCKVKDKRGDSLGSTRAGRCSAAAHKPRYSEDIEMFTSSEDEHAPVKRPRPAAEKPAETSHAVSFTGLKAPTSQTLRGNIDSVLGRLLRLFMWCFAGR